MRTLLFILLCSGSLLEAAEASPRELRREAERSLRQAEDWVETSQLLESLINTGTNGEVNIPAALLSQAHAYGQQSNWVQAIEALEQIDRFEDPLLEERLQLDRGIARMQRAAQTAATNNWQEAAQLASSAIESTEKSLELNHRNPAAKHNLELALQRLAYYEKKLEEQQQDRQNEEQNEDNENEQDDQEDQSGEQENEEDGQQENQPGDPQQDQDESDSDEQQDGESDPAQEPEDGEQEDEDPSASNPGDESGDDPETKTPPPSASGEMTREEAERLLDALMEQEELKRAEREEKMRSRNIPVEKNW